MPKLLSLALLALLILIACSDLSQTALVPPTEAPLPEATAPSDNQPVQTQPAVPTEEPTVESISKFIAGPEFDLGGPSGSERMPPNGRVPKSESRNSPTDITSLTK